MLRALRHDQQTAARLGDVFSAPGTRRLIEWLLEPAVVTSDGSVVNRYLAEVYRMRADVRDAFPALEGADGSLVIDWAWRSGRHELDLQESLLPAPIDPRTAAQRHRPRRLPRELDPAGGVGWRMHEAADLVTGERRRGAAARRRRRVRAATLSANASYRAGPYRGVVTLIRSEEHHDHTLLDYWYGVESAGIVELRAAGTHRSMLREPDVASLSGCLRQLVDEACDLHGLSR